MEPNGPRISTDKETEKPGISDKGCVMILITSTLARAHCQDIESNMSAMSPHNVRKKVVG